MWVIINIYFAFYLTDYMWVRRRGLDFQRKQEFLFIVTLSLTAFSPKYTAGLSPQLKIGQILKVHFHIVLKLIIH